jgi:hypothetical protein
MIKNSLLIYCITNKAFPYLNSIPYKKAGVGQEHFPNNYYLANSLENIFYKEKYYSELAFQYWLWKNKLNKIKKDTWIGFCQKRRFWIKKNSLINKVNIINLKKNIITIAPKEWNKYESVIVNPIFVNNMKKIKILKRGFRSLIKDPEIFFNIRKQTIKLHFDMHHGYGNLDKAINLLDISDKGGFKNYVNNSNSFNPHLMFISKPAVANEWFSKLFPWLFRCENEFGFKNLSGYDTTRLYAYLAERYLSYWFKKYTNYIEWPIVTLKHY